MQNPMVWIGALLLLLTASPVGLAQSQGEYYGPHMMWGSYYGMLLGPLMMIVFIAIIVGLVVLIVRWLGTGQTSTQHSARSAAEPPDILRERFARGEIDKEEFEERRRVLGE